MVLILVILFISATLLFAILHDRPKLKQLLIDTDILMGNEEWESFPSGVMLGDLPFFDALPSGARSNSLQKPFFQNRTVRGHCWLFGNVSSWYSIRQGATIDRTVAAIEIEWPFDFWVRVQRRDPTVTSDCGYLLDVIKGGEKIWLVASKEGNPLANEIVREIALAMSQYKFGYIQVSMGYLIIGHSIPWDANAYPEVWELSCIAHDTVMDIVKRQMTHMQNV